MITKEPLATQLFGKQWAQSLEPGTIVALHGDLGAGKTTLAKGIIAELTGVPFDAIQSPTFTLMNLYEGKCPIYHFDLYRLKSAEEFIAKGFVDFLESDGICLIEWPERIEPLLPPKTKHITLSHVDENARRIDV